MYRQLDNHTFSLTSAVFRARPGDALCSVYVRDSVGLLPGVDRFGASSADPPSHRLVPRRRTLLSGCGADMAGCLLHFTAFPLLQHPHQ